MDEKIQSLDRVFKILEEFEKYPKGLSLTELSKNIGLHKSTVHRFLNTLIKLGYVKQKDDSTYDLTFKLYNISRYKVENIDLIKLSHKHIQNLSREINEVVHLVIQDGIYGIYIDKIDSDNTITLKSQVGNRTPLIYTSVGKAILSTYDDETIQEIWNKSPHIKKGKNTIMNLKDFMDEINKTRETKISIDNEENEDGIYCIGTNINTNIRDIKAAISITGPLYRMKEKICDKMYKELLKCAENISKELK